MKAVIQTVLDASVKVDGEVVGAIDRGMLVYFGVEKDDDAHILKPFFEKLLKLRIFKDGEGRMNLSLSQAGGSMLLVSQFTLASDIYKGNRPGFETAAAPQAAQELYLKAVDLLRSMGIAVETGRFGAHMHVCYCNDGPETFILDSNRLKIKAGS